MEAYDHVIMRQRVVVNVSDQKQYKTIQHAITQALEDKFTALLDQIFTQHVPKDVVITIDQLQVDVAMPNLKAIAERIPIQIQQKLPAVVKAKVNQAIHDPQKRHVTPLPKAKLNAVQHYLTHGYFAWWMPTNTDKAIEAIYLTLMHELPDALQDLWFQLRQTPSALSRFVTQFSPSTIKKTVQLLNSAHGNKIVALVEDLINVQQAIHLPATQQAFNKKAWEITLSQLLIPKAPFFNEFDFVQTTFKKLAHECSLSYSAFVWLVAKYLEKKHACYKPQSNFPTIVNQLHEDLVIPNAATSQKARLPSLIKRFDTLLAQHDYHDKNAYAVLLAEVVTKKEEPGVKELLLGWIKPQAHSQQLARQLSSSQMVSLIQMLQPTLTHTFGLMNHLWRDVLSQEDLARGGETHLIQQLTLNYLSQQLIAATPQTYLTYLGHVLTKHTTISLAKLAAVAKQKKAQLAQVHPKEIIDFFIQQCTVATALKPTLLANLSMQNFSAHEREQLVAQLLQTHYPLVKTMRATLLASSATTDRAQLDQLIFTYVRQTDPNTFTVPKMVAYLLKHTVNQLSFSLAQFKALLSPEDTKLATAATNILEAETSTTLASSSLVDALRNALQLPPTATKSPDLTLEKAWKDLLPAALQQQGTLNNVSPRVQRLVKHPTSESAPTKRQSLEKQIKQTLAASDPHVKTLQETHQPSFQHALDALSNALRRPPAIAPDEVVLQLHLAKLKQLFDQCLQPSTRTKTLEVALEKAWQDLLAAALQQQATMNNVFPSVQHVVKHLISEPDPTKQQSLVRQIEQVLTAGIEQRVKTLQETYSLFSSQIVHDFFIVGTLPQGYTQKTAFVEAMIAATPPAMLKDHIRPLLQQKDVITTIVETIAGKPRETLLAALVPLSPILFTTYRAVLLQADVLRAVTMAEKQRALDTLFLHLAGQFPTASAQQFSQLALLKISQQANIPKLLLFRRMRLAAAQHDQGTAIMTMLEPIEPTVDTMAHEVADALDIAFLPTYEAIRNLLAIDVRSQYYTLMLPAMKQAVQQGGVSAAQVAAMIALALPTIGPSKQHSINEIVTKAIQQVTAAHAQTVTKTWHHFLQTGALGSYTSPHALFEAFISQKSLHVQRLLYNLMQTPHRRKRLVAHLPDKDLEKLILVLHEKAAKTIIKHINTVYALWSYGGTQAIPRQDARNAWWEATLQNLAAPVFQEKTWLKNSLLSLSAALSIQPNALLYALIAATKVVLAPTKADKSFVRLLKTIQQDGQQENRKAAKKVWPTQPALRELHKLLTVGLAAFAEHKVTALTRLEQQLQQLIDKQGITVKEELLRHPNKENVAYRLAYYFSSTTVKHFLRLLASQAYPFIQQYMALTTKHPPNTIDPFTWRKYNEVAVLTYLLANTRFEPQALLQHCLEKLCHETKMTWAAMKQLIQADTAANHNEVRTLLAAMVAARETASLTHEEVQEEALPAEEAITEDVKVYVQNGGLVFLWPFLTQFLTDQGLLKDNQFVDKTALHNAVHAIQYIVTERLCTPEWQLVLNKLLCGINFGEVVTTQYTLKDQHLAATLVSEATQDIAEAETKATRQKTKAPTAQPVAEELPPEIVLLQQNCNAILAHTMAQWKNLQKLQEADPYQAGFTVTDFREYFLQRQGILHRIKAETGSYWHLTLALAPYDSVDIIPPWTLKKVQLPWMKEALIIFWMPE